MNHSLNLNKYNCALKINNAILFQYIFCLFNNYSSAYYMQNSLIKILRIQWQISINVYPPNHESIQENKHKAN